MYVYINSEPGLWTVGFYSPSGEWMPESDHKDKEGAASRVAWLNGQNLDFNARGWVIDVVMDGYQRNVNGMRDMLGGRGCHNPGLDEALNSGDGVYRP